MKKVRGSGGKGQCVCEIEVIVKMKKVGGGLVRAGGYCRCEGRIEVIVK